MGLVTPVKANASEPGRYSVGNLEQDRFLALISLEENNVRVN